MRLVLFQFLIVPITLFGQGRVPTSKDVESYKSRSIKPTGSISKSSHDQVNQLLREERQSQQIRRPNIKYELPEESCDYKKYFIAAFDSLELMFPKNDFDLSRAVFHVENAYAENSLSWKNFNTSLNALVAKSKANQKGTSTQDKCMAIFLTMKEHFEFDFEDPFGYQDMTKLMTYKALHSESGQCYSLSLIYLLIAERMKVKAHLALSPSHTYIMFQDNKKNWVHIDLTSGIIMSEAFVMQSGYVKSEALRSGIYMEPMPKKEVLGMLYTDLARYYGAKCKLTPFALKCINRCLAINPNNIIANLLKSDYLTIRLQYVLDQLGNPDKIYDKKAWEVYTEMTAIYDKVDALGYEPIPFEVYDKWVKDMNGQDENSKKLENNLLND